MLIVRSSAGLRRGSDRGDRSSVSRSLVKPAGRDHAAGRAP